jgi:hypothetical protein
MSAPGAARDADESMDTMSRAEIAAFVEFMLGRCANLQRLATVTDPMTMAHYMAALHYDVRDRFDAVVASLDEEHPAAPN